MASVSRTLSFVKDFSLQKILNDLFGGLVAASPDAITAADPAAITALVPPDGGTGATEGAYDTAAHRDALIASVTALRTDLTATRAEVVKLVTDITALRTTVAAMTNLEA